MPVNQGAISCRFLLFLFTFYFELITAQTKFFPPFFVKELDLPDGSSKFAVGDINNDGFPDFIVASRGAITCFINSGNYEFNPGFKISVRETPSALEICDLENDGKAEIVTVYKSNSKVGIFGADTSDFKKVVDFETGIYPEMLVCSDVDLNGLKDIVTVGKIMLGVTINYQVEPIRFSMPVNFSPTTPLKKIQIVDLNYDDVPDLVGIDWLNNLLVVSYGRGDGKFGQVYKYQLPEEPVDFAVADLNNDGYFDYAIAFYYINEVQFFYTTSAGITSRFKLKIPKPASVHIADINGDGLKDIFVGSDKKFFLILNFGTKFEQYDFLCGTLSQIECIDVDKNGKDDILVLDTNEKRLMIYYSSDEIDFSKNFSIAIGSNLSDFVSADFDRNGYVDFILAGGDSSLLSIYFTGDKFLPSLNLVNKTFSEIKFLSVSDSNYLACTNYESGDVSIFRFKGGGRFQEIFKYNFDKPKPIFLGLAQDRSLSFFLSLSDSNFVILKPNDESDFDELTVKEIDSTKVIASTIWDFNDDGYFDIVFVNRDTSSVKLNVFMRKNSRTYAKNYTANLNSLIKRAFLFTDDFNGDGFGDILAYYEYSTAKVTEGEIVLLINDGAGKFRIRRRIDTHVYLSGRRVLKIADMNGDLAKDFLIFDKLKNRLYLYINKGGSFEKVEIGRFKNINALGVADVNHDGLLDIIMLNGARGTLDFLFNKDGVFK